MSEQQTEEIKLHEQQDGSFIIGDKPEEKEEPADKETEESGDESLAHTDDAEAGDESASDDETEEEAEARRQRNRERRAENKTRRKEYVESLKRELAARDAIISDLANRVSSVERSSTSTQMAQLDNAIRDAEAQYKELQDINRQAIEQANGEVAVAAQEKMFELRNKYNQLIDIKKGVSRQATQPKTLDPRLKNHAEAWASKNKWFDASGSDTDSRIALTIDSQMDKEGWNPTTSEYWEELDARIKRYLPHKVSKGYNQNKGNKSAAPVAGGNKEMSNSSKSSYTLSQERVNALKDAGLWDDPEKRAKAIKNFQAYDKQQGSN
jgi:hypothetical protein